MHFSLSDSYGGLFNYKKEYYYINFLNYLSTIQLTKNWKKLSSSFNNDIIMISFIGVVSIYFLLVNTLKKYF